MDIGIVVVSLTKWRSLCQVQIGQVNWVIVWPWGISSELGQQNTVTFSCVKQLIDIFHLHPKYLFVVDAVFW